MPGRSRTSATAPSAPGRPKAQPALAGPAGSGALVLVQPEPWWARYALALLKLVLAFALAVLTLVFTQSGAPPGAPHVPTAPPPSAPVAVEDDAQPAEPDEDHQSAP